MPLLNTLALVVCLGKRLSAQERAVTRNAATHYEGAELDFLTLRLAEFPETLGFGDQATAVVAGHLTLEPHQIPNSITIAGGGSGGGGGSIHPRNRSCKPAWLAAR